MSIQNKMEFKVMRNEDIDKFDKNNFDKVDHLHIDMSQSQVESTKIAEILDRLSLTKQDRKFHLDLKKVKLDEIITQKIIKCLSSWTEMTNLHLHFSEVPLDEQIFMRLVKEGIVNLKNLTKIHLLLDNCNINNKMLTQIEHVIKSLPKLSNIRLNFKNNKLSEKDLMSIKTMINSYPSNELLWE